MEDTAKLIPANFTNSMVVITTFQIPLFEKLGSWWVKSIQEPHWSSDAFDPTIPFSYIDR